MAKILKDKLEKYIIRFPQKRKKLNVRDYIIPTGWKKKRNISGNIDKFLYGIDGENATEQNERRPFRNVRDYILPMEGKKEDIVSEIDRIVYELD